MSTNVVARCQITAIVLVSTILVSPAYAGHKAGHGGGGGGTPTPTTTTLSTLGCTDLGQVARVDAGGEWVCDDVLDGVDGAQGPVGPTGADGAQGPTGPAGADAQFTANYVTNDLYTSSQVLPIGVRVSMTSVCNVENDQIIGGGCRISPSEINTGWSLQATIPGFGVTQPDGAIRDEWQCTWTCNTSVSPDAVVIDNCAVSTFEITGICAGQL